MILRSRLICSQEICIVCCLSYWVSPQCWWIQAQWPWICILPNLIIQEARFPSYVYTSFFTCPAFKWHDALDWHCPAAWIKSQLLKKKFSQIKFCHLISKFKMVQFLKVTGFLVFKYSPYVELHQAFKTIYFLCIFTSPFYINETGNVNSDRYYFGPTF